MPSGKTNQPAEEQPTRLSDCLSLEPASKATDASALPANQSVLASFDKPETKPNHDRYEYSVGSLFAGKYEVLGHVGRGGMGVVYKVRNVATGGEPRAIKTLEPDRAGGNFDVAIRRFQIEAKALHRLGHENIVQVHDFVYEPDKAPPYLLMEFVEGVSLAHLIKKRGRLPTDLALEIARQLCLGLAKAHEKNILHRDLKPQNIMIKCKDPNAADLGGEFIVKILDFGIAKIFDTTDNAPTLTKTGEVFGSPPYMSPEQCTGKHVDERSDIYSLGCVIYECLTSQTPFVCDNVVAAVQAHINETPPTLREGSQALDFPKDLETFVQRLLKKNPAERHQTMMEVLQDLENLQGGKPPIPATQAGSAKSSSIWQQRKTPITIFGAAITLLILALIPFWQHAAEVNDRPTKTPTAPAVSVDDAILGMPSMPELERGSKSDRSVKALVDARQIQDPLKLDNRDLTDQGLLYLTQYENVLNSIDISGTNVTNAGMKHIGQLRDLKMLRLDRTGITDAGIRNLVAERSLDHAKYKPLIALLAEHDLISNQSISQLHNLPALQILDLSYTLVTDDGLRALTNSAPAVKELDLSNDNISDAGLAECAKLKYLIFLGVSHTRMTDRGLRYLISNRDLRSINASYTRITDGGLVRFLKKFPKFNALYLRNTQISDQAISAIARSKDLQWLDLRNTRVSDRGLLRLASVTSLKELAVSGSGVTADGITRFKQLNRHTRIVSDITYVHCLIWIDGSPQYNLFSQNQDN